MTIVRVATFVALLAFVAQAKKFADNWVERQEWDEFEEFLRWKKSKELQDGSDGRKRWEGERQPIVYSEKKDDLRKGNEKEPQDPPPIDQAALMARYIVNQADWTSVATISSRKEIESFPFVNVISFSDGALGNGSGVPYLFLTPLDFTAQDLARDHRSTLMMTLAQGDYCKKKVWDPMDPRCARVVLSGKIKTIKNGSSELDIAKKAVFTRHPWLANMPPDHHFFFAKLKIISIAVLDTFGGPKYVTVNDYLHPPTPNATEEFLRRYYNRNDYEADSVAYNVQADSNFLNPVVRNV